MVQTDVSQGDVLGELIYQLEVPSGTDAILVGAAINAI